MVTAELAVGFATVALCLAMGLGAITLGVDEVRCVDAAHVAARAAARGEAEVEVRRLAATRAPHGSRVELAHGPGEVTVSVWAPGRPGTEGVGLEAHASASTPVEQRGG